MSASIVNAIPGTVLVNNEAGSDLRFIHHGGLSVPEDYREPEFERFDAQEKHVHEWLSYISPALRALWPSFTHEQKAAIAANAERLASNEHWD
jgi:hypothetical protein